MKDSVKNILLEIVIFFSIIAIAIGCAYMQNHRVVFNEDNKIVKLEKVEAKMSIYEKREINMEHGAIYIIAGISIILFVMSFDMISRNESTKKSSKEVENLISPSLAEVVVDGKLEIKSFLMTTIIDLSLKGNIEIINNATLRLLSKRNLETYEEKVINLIFQNGEITTFKNINNIFKDSNSKTVIFSQKMADIKKLIIENLIKNKIFSPKKTVINKVVTMLSVFCILNLILVLAGFFKAMEGLIIINIIVFCAYMYFIFRGTSILEKKETNAYNSEKRKFHILLLCIFISFVLTIGRIIIYKPQMIIWLVFVLALNIIIIRNSKDVVLTDKGKREKIKLLKLKNYINEYSLIKDRDLNSAVVWDKYLAYATAFEIPNKVTDSIYESWLDLNITLQFIDRLL